jgi:hypothetical protein
MLELNRDWWTRPENGIRTRNGGVEQKIVWGRTEDDGLEQILWRRTENSRVEQILWSRTENQWN